jgi:hypothetical protein
MHNREREPKIKKVPVLEAAVPCETPSVAHLVNHTKTRIIVHLAVIVDIVENTKRLHIEAKKHRENGLDQTIRNKKSVQFLDTLSGIGR